MELCIRNTSIDIEKQYDTVINDGNNLPLYLIILNDGGLCLEQYVALMGNYCDEAYHFANLTKNYIAKQAFSTVNDAEEYLDKLRDECKIIGYIRM